MLRVALTGGIGSGKSTVADFFKTLGAAIIDADKIAWVITQPNTEYYQSIVDHFGSSILENNNLINRQALREIIFKNPQERQWLEALLHPEILKIMQDDIQKVQSDYCILVIPLLTESKKIDFVDRVLVVDAPMDIQLARAQQRDKNSEMLIQAIINSQSSREQRLAIADDVITNDQDLNHLKQQVERLHQRYLTIG